MNISLEIQGWMLGVLYMHKKKLCECSNHGKIIEHIIQQLAFRILVIAFFFFLSMPIHQIPLTENDTVLSILFKLFIIYLYCYK